MISPKDVASLVPEVYAEYRQVVADGVMFFLERLTGPRLSAILAGQAALPAEAPPSQRLVGLMRECPALHKLGQVLARRRELDPGFRRRLQTLESMQSRIDLSEVRPVILRELGDHIERYRIRLEAQALAEASVAVVIPFTWAGHNRSKAAAKREAGVLKVLKPRAAEYLEEDLEILGQVADFLDERRKIYGLPPVEFREVFDEVRTILLHEIQVSGEQAHLAAAGRRYAGRRDVWVPRLYPFSTAGVTAMERVDGVKVTEASGESYRLRRNLARTIARALITEAIFSRRERTIFHGDPHAGNLLAVPDGRLGVLDWSLTGELTRHDRVQMSQILARALCGDRAGMAEAISRLASETPSREIVRPVVDRAMWELHSLLRPTVDWLMRLMDGAARAGVRFRPDLLLFRKSFFTLEGVITDLCPECSMEDFITEVLIEEFAGEWPTRWLRPPLSRDYATHLSNADLLEIGTMAPMRAMRWWLGL
ncbi:MAG TPA: AarF/ABC1/UbiB kinase family protein [Phycisphaerae bacterium]|jgi:ubiquinone biosynthesis protein|nr:AarF/ABC1/UbiB kinase family protein [Phycisphaerae bacterium]HOJ56415.1 AarF/ABC1/UbiB kinase family protein [Phycisphaerae bacterium]HOL28245.1 AarF/ABC1/UbiB kinase family protein [Phycisphaerae bacterium]HPP22500.1 AarF/ABC1/UbiB kinase family protein [Phycisphaerae bacterium]HPU31062.1 AarF/ABC1/UbiB kinase family protein [Phycisphaerae bacterium]